MGLDNKTDSADEMTFGEHLDVFRKILIQIAAVVGVVFLVLFTFFKGQIVDMVFAPAMPSFPTNRLLDWLADMTGTDALRINSTPAEIYNTKMAGQFLLHIKSSLIGALIISFPFLIERLWNFVRPALSIEARRKSRRIVLEIPAWFILGICFGYFMVAPLAVDFLSGYRVSDNISNIIDLNSYISVILGISFAGGLIFQLPLLVRLLVTVGLIGSEWMVKNRKYAVVVLLVISAAITPPDVMSQLLIFCPFYALYEYGIIIARRIERDRARHEKAATE